MLSILLKEVSIDVRSIGNGPEALVLACREPFDLYLIDTWIPGTDGIALCRLLRSLDPVKPIVFYSGATANSIQELATEAGASAYVVKPSLDELVATIARLVYVEPVLERFRDSRDSQAGKNGDRRSQTSANSSSRGRTGKIQPITSNVSSNQS
jgi:DNA-binding response OmpR family regulator